MKNLIIIIILAIACALTGWSAYQQSAKVGALEEEILACKKAAEESSAEAFILQQLANKHKAEAEEHKKIAEVHKKIAEEAKKKVLK